MTPLAARIRAAGPLLSVGILSADLLRLGEQLAVLADSGVGVVHFDVMDGVFCRTLTAGPPLVAAVPSTFVKDVHLMIDEPLDKVDDYVAAGAGIVTFHPEATRHPRRVLERLAGSGVVRGVALTPATPLAAVEPLLDELELVLVLAVDPRRSGQTFAATTADRVAALRELVSPATLIGIDGGVTASNIEHVAALLPDLVVSGSAVFAGDAAANARAFAATLARAPTAARPELVPDSPAR